MQPPPAKSPRIACPKCAGQNPELARFCSCCGADLTAPIPPIHPREHTLLRTIAAHLGLDERAWTRLLDRHEL